MSVGRRVVPRKKPGRRRVAAPRSTRKRAALAELPLSIRFTVRAVPRTRGWLERTIPEAVAATQRAMRCRIRSVSIGVIGDAAMRRFNREFHATDETTDVLSFDLSDDRSIEGEILVCAPYARREARSRGIPWQTELVLYIVHGLLHLCGEDDHAPADARRMRRLECGILGRIGLPLPPSHLNELKFDAG